MRVLAVLVLVLLGTPLAEAARKDVPLPVSKTSLCKDRTVNYIVDGKQRIPPGVEITMQKGTRIVGVNDAVLSVAGSFGATGVTDSEVSISGVRIVVEPKAKDVHLDMCNVGPSSGVFTAPNESTAAIITVENSEVDGDPGIDVTMHAGKVKVMSCTVQKPMKLTGVGLDGKKTRSFANIRTSTIKGIEVHGFNDVTVRHCQVEGAAVFKNNALVVFDGNHVLTVQLDFEHADPKLMKKLKVTKNDFITGPIRVFAPLAAGKKTSVIFQKCFYGGVTDLKKIDAEWLTDRDDDPENAVKVIVKKAAKRAHGFGKRQN